MPAPQFARSQGQKFARLVRPRAANGARAPRIIRSPHAGRNGRADPISRPRSGDGAGPAAGEPSQLQEIQAELISRKFPAGQNPAPDVAAAPHLTSADYANYIDAHSSVGPS